MRTDQPKPTMKMTPLQRRILGHLEQRGDLDIQEMGYEFSSNPRGTPKVFKHPAAATWFGGKLAAPLRRCGWIEPGDQRFAYRRKLRITTAGRQALRECADAR